MSGKDVKFLLWCFRFVTSVSSASSRYFREPAVLHAAQPDSINNNKKKRIWGEQKPWRVFLKRHPAVPPQGGGTIYMLLVLFIFLNTRGNNNATPSMNKGFFFLFFLSFLFAAAGNEFFLCLCGSMFFFFQRPTHFPSDKLLSLKETTVPWERACERACALQCARAR